MNKDVFNLIFSTHSNFTGLALRLTLGIVLYPHAVQKLFGWFNGPGLSGEMQFMTTQAGLPVFLAVMAIIVECTGTFMLLTGAGTRIAAIALFCLFIGMITTFHFQHGFFMNWFGKLPSGKEGFEYHLLVLGLCITIFLEGGGSFSIDKWLTGE
jgi:putative oxidoreductase